MFLKRILVLLACIAIPSTAFGQQVQDAATNFEIPSFETRSLDVHGDDLFSLNDGGALSINLGSDFYMASQTPEETWSVRNSLEIDMSKANSDAEMGQVITNNVWANYRKFFNGSRGFSAIANLQLSFGMNKEAIVDAEMGQSLNAGVAVGVGYGRKHDAKTVAQAAAMCAASGKECTAADLNKIADIIGKNSANYYEREYKADAAVEFNKELSAATGGDAFKNAQVLGSPIYNIGSRHVGWEAAATFNVDAGDYLKDVPEGGAEAGMSMHIQAGGGYGMLLDDNSGIDANLNFRMGLGAEYAGTVALNSALESDHPGDGAMAVAVDVGYNLDHSTSWNSQAKFEFAMDMPKEGDASNSWKLHLESNYALGTQALAGIAIDAGSAAAAVVVVPVEGEDPPVAEEASDLSWSVKANFTYFIF